MFDFVRKHTRLMQLILLVLIVPSFVLFGVEGYQRFNEGGGQQTIAKVDGTEIRQSEWDAAFRTQMERVRQRMPNVDPSLFDTPEMRQAVLDNLVRERVLLTAANRLHLVTGDERLQRLFVADPQFAFLRKPDGSVNTDVLMAQGMSSEIFAERLRQDYSVRQVTAGIEGSALATAATADAALNAMLQRREVQVQRFDVKDYRAKVTPTDAEIEAYYKDPAHAAQYRAPEQASIEYVTLDLDTLAKGVTVSEDELRQYYEQNIAAYSTPEERRASHILVKAEKAAPAAERDAAKAKAEGLLAKAKAADAKQFAELARQNSDDPGSAANGGDLDFFGRGAMVKPFEDAAFSLQPGQTSDVIESDFGFHIIRTTAVRGGEKKSFEQVRPEIEAAARRQQAEKLYAEAAEQFTNLVYEQADSLKPVADKLKLEVRSATMLRQPAPGTSGPLASPKLIEAVFSAEALNDKRNTAAIEVGANQLVSARVLQHTPARTRPLEEVRDQVRDAVVNAAALALARKDGEARLEAGRTEPASTLPGAALTVSRAQPEDLAPELLEAVLRADAKALPAWVGMELPGTGYAVARVAKVLERDPAAVDVKQAQQQYGQAWAIAEAQAYYDALKARYKVEVHAPPAASRSTDDAPR